MGWITRVFLVLTLVLVAACEPDPPPPPNSVDSKPAETGVPQFAYAEKGKLRLMRAGVKVVELDADTGEQAEWSPDGSRFVAIAGEELVSIDARTGAVARAACTCRDVAVVAGKVFASADYGATELKVFDLATLKALGPLRLDKGVSSIAGAGDRLVTFQITETGARDESELVVIEPVTGKTTNVGKVGQVADTAFTPRGWWGGPLFAYATTGSSGAMTAVADVFWLDPTSPAEQVQTSDQELRQTTPKIADADWNSSRDHLWWAADGTLRTAAWTWSCTYGGLSGPQCGEKSAHNQWRYDGAEWARTDERDFDSVLDIGAGSSLELGRGEEDKPLTLVEGEKRTALSAHVRRLWTPPQLGTSPAGPPGTQEMALRFAPTVWLHPEEKNFPGNASDYIRKSVLRFDHGDICEEGDEPVATDLDETRLGRGEGYAHKEAVRSGIRNPCKHLDDGRTFHSNAPADQGKKGGKGFYLDSPEEVRPGNTPDADKRVNAPVYWEYVPPKAGRLGAYLYWFFYPYNDFHIGALPNLQHEGDWERVAVQIDGDRPVGVAFAKHGGPVCSKPWDDMAKSGTRAEVFSAKGSHASYPFEDEYPTLGPTSDHTGKGFAWDAATSLLNVKDQPWYGYRGLWGRLGVHKNTSGPAGPWPKRDMSASLTTEIC
ncbi:MAG: hypothetical protein M3548_19920 [Actinomycetota bacterium]|nr:hypothetical protein [Actinomycetota bacterium]